METQDWGNFFERNKGYLKSIAASALFGMLLSSCAPREHAGLSAPNLVEYAVPPINWVRAIWIGILSGAGGGVWQWLNAKTRILSDAAQDEEGKPSLINIRPANKAAGIVNNAIQGGAAGFFLSITLENINLLREHGEFALRIIAPSLLGLCGWLSLRTDK